MLLLNQGSKNILVLRRQLTGSDGDLVGVIDVGDGPTGLVVLARTFGQVPVIRAA